MKGETGMTSQGENATFFQEGQKRMRALKGLCDEERIIWKHISKKEQEIAQNLNYSEMYYLGASE